MNNNNNNHMRWVKAAERERNIQPKHQQPKQPKENKIHTTHHSAQTHNT